MPGQVDISGSNIPISVQERLAIIPSFLRERIANRRVALAEKTAERNFRLQEDEQRRQASFDFIKQFKVAPIDSVNKRRNEIAQSNINKFKAEWLPKYIEHKGNLPSEQLTKMFEDRDKLMNRLEEMNKEEQMFKNAFVEYGENGSLYTPETKENLNNYITNGIMPKEGFLVFSELSLGAEGVRDYGTDSKSNKFLSRKDLDELAVDNYSQLFNTDTRTKIAAEKLWDGLNKEEQEELLEQYRSKEKAIYHTGLVEYSAGYFPEETAEERRLKKEQEKKAKEQKEEAKKIVDLKEEDGVYRIPVGKTVKLPDGRVVTGFNEDRSKITVLQPQKINPISKKDYLNKYIREKGTSFVKDVKAETVEGYFEKLKNRRTAEDNKKKKDYGLTTKESEIYGTFKEYEKTIIESLDDIYDAYVREHERTQKYSGEKEEVEIENIYGDFSDKYNFIEKKDDEVKISDRDSKWEKKEIKP